MKYCGIYQLIWLFFLGSFVGDIIEMIFCRITDDVWMSRSSVVWGAFSLVWGIGITLMTAILYRFREKRALFLFIAGTILGGVYEYACSVFTEFVFGKIFWDYSNVPFNLGGRINLLFCVFWGFAAVVWFRYLYRPVAACIAKIPEKIIKPLTWIAVVFMCCNIAVSAYAFERFNEREQGITATDDWQQWLDTHYDDTKMEKIYPSKTETE